MKKTSSRPPARPARKTRRRRFLVWTSAVYLGVLVVLVFVEWFVAERHWLATLVTYMPQHPFGVLPALLLLVSLAARQARAAAINAVSVVFFALTLLGFNIPAAMFVSPPAGDVVRVMTYNVNHSQRGAIRVAEVVEDLHPDVICLQEADPILHWSNTVNELARLLPEWDYTVHGELVTFSRYPIASRSVELIDPPRGRVVLRADLDVRGRRLTVLNVHFPTSMTGGESLRRCEGPLRAYMAGAAAVRAQMAKRTREVVRRVEEPFVLAGDFNTPPRGRVYRRLTGIGTDAFRRAGWGTGFTYRSDLPVLRIDYIFAGPGVKPISCRAVQAPASDHRPVIADLVLVRPISR